MPLRKHKYRLVYIEWIDVLSHDIGWESINEAKQWAKEADWIASHVAWIIDDTDKYLLLSSIITNTGSVNDCFKIPKAYIKKVIPITDKRFK